MFTQNEVSNPSLLSPKPIRPASRFRAAEGTPCIYCGKRTGHKCALCGLPCCAECSEVVEGERACVGCI
jgi:hypothetical protein